MKKYIINGGRKLKGTVSISGSKNVASKALIAACLTCETVEIRNVPLISDLFTSLEVIEEIGGKIDLQGHKVKIRLPKVNNIKVPLDAGVKTRTSSLFLAPLLLHTGQALVPNPGGCRLGARPIDRHIEGLKKMGVIIKYNSYDGYFHASAKKLKGTTYTFDKNTHTGTETLLLAAACATGKTILYNAAEEPEVDDLISILNQMGGKIKRQKNRTIEIYGVNKLHGTMYSIMPDRNEAVTFAIVSALTGGKIFIKNINLSVVKEFLKNFKKVGGEWEAKDSSVRFFINDKLLSTSVVTSHHPGFMTDWQGPWSILMTQANGESMIHETIYENRFSYVEELNKMGAKLSLISPIIKSPKSFYNFNYDSRKAYKQGLKIYGPTKLHNAVLNISDLRAGATLVLAALIARGESVVYGVEHIERGYERFDSRLRNLGADIETIEE